MNRLRIFSFVSPLSISNRFVSTNAKPKTGVLMLNMGGPETTNDVYDFLLRLFSDPEIFKLPAQRLLASWVAKWRAPSIQEKYSEIGGGSPIVKWSECQGKALVRVLDSISPETGPHKFYLGFRYVHPLTEESINEIEADGVERVIAFSQYPQYSCTTSGSSFNSIAAHYNSPVHGGLAGIDNIKAPLSQRNGIARPGPIWSFIDRWPTMKHLVQVFADNIRLELSKMPEHLNKNETTILFSAHSLPMTSVNRGDPYIQEVSATVQAVMQELNFSHPYRLVWQSKVGPMPWMGQDTKSALRGLARLGKRQAILVPIAFTSDHIETLHEMDIEYAADVAKQVGMLVVRRAAAPNDNPLFVQGLADLVHSHLREGLPASNQFFLRCPSCINERCAKARFFIEGERERVATWTQTQSFRLANGSRSTYRKLSTSE